MTMKNYGKILYCEIVVFCRGILIINIMGWLNNKFKGPQISHVKGGRVEIGASKIIIISKTTVHVLTHLN